jgi:glutamine amidotransferase
VEPRDPEIVAGRTRYGIEFTSCIEMENVTACQFHPEKSHDAGLRFLENFLRKALLFD